VTSPDHYLLYVRTTDLSDFHKPLGRWGFRLQLVDGSKRLEASDEERGFSGERLQLFALMRGLEALEQPSRVTLVNPPRAISRGLLYGLEAWRACHWRWERFGQLVPVRNADLWQRIEHALKFHTLDCRNFHAESAHRHPRGPHFSLPQRRIRAAIHRRRVPANGEPATAIG
jgi:ribonuclease HI